MFGLWAASSSVGPPASMGIPPNPSMTSRTIFPPAERCSWRIKSSCWITGLPLGIEKPRARLGKGLLTGRPAELEERPLISPGFEKLHVVPIERHLAPLAGAHRG